MGAIRTSSEILPDTDLEIEEGSDRMAPQSLHLTPFELAANFAFAFAL